MNIFYENLNLFQYHLEISNRTCINFFPFYFYFSYFSCVSLTLEKFCCVFRYKITHRYIWQLKYICSILIFIFQLLWLNSYVFSYFVICKHVLILMERCFFSKTSGICLADDHQIKMVPNNSVALNLKCENNLHVTHLRSK